MYTTNVLLLFFDDECHVLQQTVKYRNDGNIAPKLTPNEYRSFLNQDTDNASC